ncbi:MAG: hypothetical protein OXS35_00345 [Dehalococcoidia bacterium]|nr:hypothetical protein [Dehalococcoidia bacterium]
MSVARSQTSREGAIQYKSYESQKEQVWLLVELVLRAIDPKATDEKIASTLKTIQLMEQIENLVERIVRIHAGR